MGLTLQVGTTLTHTRAPSAACNPASVRKFEEKVTASAALWRLTLGGAQIW